jgi:BirA family biotin operon repressor/biotin-[acetyl-CoA-carboxylase] ligase
MAKGFMLKIIYLDKVDSTQKYLKKKLLNKELVSPVAVTSDIQTNGVGSRDNSWESFDENLFLSFAIKISELPKDLQLESASIYFAHILKETLQALGSKVWIKWPNDFYIEDKKIGGMITNIVEDNLLCGVGLNTVNAPKEFSKLDLEIDKYFLLKQYFINIEKKVLWKQVFSKYKLEFYRSQKYFTHISGKKVSLREAKLNGDGSLQMNGDRVYSLR